VVGSGKPTQLPLETLKSLPVVLVPETSGVKITVGKETDWSIDAGVKKDENPKLL
jgi:hypothetical protein